MRRALGLSGANQSGMLPAAMDPAPRAAVLENASAHRTCQRRRHREGPDRQNAFTSQLSVRVTTLEAQLATEREQHASARRRLQQADVAAQALATRSERDALAQEEELEVVRENTAKAQRALDGALLEMQQRKNTKQTTAARSHPAAKLKSKLDTAPPERPACPAPPKKRGHPRTRPVPEQKPVRWWIPSYRAKSKG